MPSFQSNYHFPHPNEADPEGNGIIAMGGDLTPNTLLHAYSMGLFPWFNEDEPIAWWSPDPRCVVYPEDFYPKKSLKKRIKKCGYLVSLNRSFTQVMTNCAMQRDIATGGEGTWISQDMITAYTELHNLGFAHSIEVWEKPEDSVDPMTEYNLIGGLYGIKLGNAFFGESMFHTRTDASKMAFSFLMKLANESQLAFVDCQVDSPHIMSLGATCIHRQRFLNQLAEVMKNPCPNWHALNKKLLPITQVLQEEPLLTC